MSERITCELCNVPLTLENGFLELCNERGGYPTDQEDTSPRTTTWRYACRHCDTSAYAIEFKRLLRDGTDGPAGWVRHLSEKSWINNACLMAVYDAYDVVLALQKKAEKAKVIPIDREPPRLPTKPYTVTQRPSRVSDNPRSISTRTRTRIMERDGFRCRRCGVGPMDARLVIDHIVPVAKGGTADESNLQTLCHPCNAGKRDHAPHPHDLGGSSVG